VVIGTVQDPSGAVDSADLDALLDRAATIVNRYGIMFRAASSVMSIVGHDDFGRVLEHVRSAFAARERQIASEIAHIQAENPG